MTICGIIAEFDPFHNGHRYLLEQARVSGATHIAVAMSGSAVQRGTPAMFDKYTRAKAAVSCGADLVLEMPAPYSCSNAEVFAKAGVSILAALGEGVVSRLVFGSEISDTGLIVRASAAVDALRQSQRVKSLLSEGMSYPAALASAVREEFGAEIASVLESPNSTLAIEYCRAIRAEASFIEPYAVERKGAAHNSRDTEDGTASASLIRERILNGEDVSDLLPYDIGPALEDICFDSKTDPIFLYHLLSADRDELLRLPDVNEALANKILKAAQEPCASAGELLGRCKSKEITAARLRRLALHLVLGVTKDDIAPVPYLRVLALNDRGREILAAGEHKLPVGTSIAKLERESPRAERVSLLERRASQLRALGTGTGLSVNEYTVPVMLSKTLDNSDAM